MLWGLAVAWFPGFPPSTSAPDFIVKSRQFVALEIPPTRTNFQEAGSREPHARPATRRPSDPLFVSSHGARAHIVSLAACEGRVREIATPVEVEKNPGSGTGREAHGGGVRDRTPTPHLSTKL